MFCMTFWWDGGSTTDTRLLNSESFDCLAFKVKVIAPDKAYGLLHVCMCIWFTACLHVHVLLRE